MKFLGDRKGYTLGSSILFFVFFMMMAIVAAGLVGGVLAYFGNGFDFRQRDAGTLFSQVKHCFDRQDFFSAGFVENPELFYKECRLSEKALQNNYIVYARKISDNKEFLVGIRDYIVRCDFTAGLKNKYLPLCAKYEFGDYEIIVGSNQNSRKVSA